MNKPVVYTQYETTVNAQGEPEIHVKHTPVTADSFRKITAEERARLRKLGWPARELDPTTLAKLGGQLTTQDGQLYLDGQVIPAVKAVEIANLFGFFEAKELADYMIEIQKDHE